MIFSIIIVSFNTKELLNDCLQSIFDYLVGEFEVIVIDNASTDGSIEMLKQKFTGKVQVISSDKNFGFGGANNLAVKQAQGKYLFFLNSDTLITENIIPKLFDCLENNENIGVLAPMLLLPDGQDQQYAHGRFPTIITSIKKDNNWYKPKDSWLETEWVSGAALIISKELFERSGGFDDHYFMYFEDIDLCKTVHDLDFKIAVLPSISIVHLGGKSLQKFNQRKHLYYQSQNYFYLKHYGWFRTLLMKSVRWPYLVFKIIKNE